MYIKNTASQHIPFAMVNASTGAALTGATVTVVRCLDGAAQAAVTGSVTEKAGGQYDFALSQADTNADTGGYLFTATGAIPYHVTIAFFAAANLPANATQFAGQTISAAAGVTVLASVGTAATSTAQTGDAFARIGAPAGASASADIAAVKVDTAAVKVQTDKLAFTVANQIDANVLDWKGATAPAMTGDAFARIGAPAGASTAADIAAVKADTAAVKLKTDNLPGSPAAVGSAMTLTSGERNSIATAHLDLVDGVETGITVRQGHRVGLAANGGKVDGGGTTTMHLRNQADDKNRVTATVDINGNRSAILLDLT